MSVEALSVRPTQSVREAMTCIDRHAKKIALVVDEGRRLLATLTDGDIRRAILAGMDLAAPIDTLLAQRPPAARHAPFTAPAGTSSGEALRLMNMHLVRHLPLVDENGRVVEVVALSELIQELPLQAVVMAGGYGQRLRPLTEHLPKAMLPMGDRPLLELILTQLRQTGIRQVCVTTHYKADVIAHHFGDGKAFGVELTYVKEDQPLGTAGALSLLQPSEAPLLVINGDIITQLDFRTMLEFHREHQAQMTVAVRQDEILVPYGVVESDGLLITGISEKPSVKLFINAGIYLLNPAVCQLIPSGCSFDMTDLISRSVASGLRVIGFPVREYWADIGHHEHYQQAIAARAAQESKV